MLERAGVELEKIQQIAKDCDLECNLRNEANDVWRRLEDKIPYCPVAYASEMLDYQAEYFNGNEIPLLDCSLILLHKKNPIGIAPLSIQFPTSQTANVSAAPTTLNSFGRVVLEPLFVEGVSESVSAKTLACFLEFAQKTQAYLSDAPPSFHVLSNPIENGISMGHKQLLQLGYLPRPEYDVFVDLSLEIEAIWTKVRKSYKSLISKAANLWQVEVITRNAASAWQEFHRLHIAVAGRVTRSDESWRLQYQALEEGRAILITLRDREGEMVGSAYFQHTRNEALYSVAAYRRDLFDQPLGHLSLWEAIKFYKSLGVSWFNIGQRFYGHEARTPTPKELAIATFKSGFATHIVPNYILHK